ncbi:helix-turn-helix transcriptional regulator [Undibacterium sp. RTI2.1]|uniref:helix-turn-helix domain-containing protein n=1 Tax=unclassified Undibacterium TaxID=2630295 RepID=UPI002B22BAD8|nr:MULTISPECIES: helix-turn-helix transcriptional regulator [unclassified Undibacterium]MEB0033227.1 helix-turn-helix transcriptional regulator [Undibacterium sp. RTI2.1]
MESIKLNRDQKKPSKKSVISLMAPEMLARIRSLGLRIRQARIHRKWRQEDLVSRSGFSRSTIDAIERGEPGTAISSYLHVLWIMGLDRELDLIADPGLDREGLSLAFSVKEKRVRIPTKVDNDF